MFGDRCRKIRSKEIKAKNETVAFVGDGGKRDSVVALAIVKCIGGLGSDATMKQQMLSSTTEFTNPGKPSISARKRKKDRLAIHSLLCGKGIVLILGLEVWLLCGSCLKDVGVIPDLNAIRIQRMKF